MKKVTKYGYRLREETIDYTLSLYDGIDQMFDTIKDVREEIANDKLAGNIPKRCKPLIFKLIVEEL